MTSAVVSHRFWTDLNVLTGILLLLTEELGDLFANFTLWDLDIVLGGAVLGHEGEKAVIGDVELGPLLVWWGVVFGLMVHLTNWYSRRVTLGTSMLWVEGDKSSSFLPVKMSMAVRWTLA